MKQKYNSFFLPLLSFLYVSSTIGMDKPLLLKNGNNKKTKKKNKEKEKWREAKINPYKQDSQKTEDELKAERVLMARCFLQLPTEIGARIAEYLLHPFLKEVPHNYVFVPYLLRKTNDELAQYIFASSSSPVNQIGILYSNEEESFYKILRKKSNDNKQLFFYDVDITSDIMEVTQCHDQHKATYYWNKEEKQWKWDNNSVVLLTWLEYLECIDIGKNDPVKIWSLPYLNAITNCYYDMIRNYTLSDVVKRIFLLKNKNKNKNNKRWHKKVKKLLGKAFIFKKNSK